MSTFSPETAVILRMSHDDHVALEATATRFAETADEFATGGYGLVSVWGTILSRLDCTNPDDLELISVNRGAAQTANRIDIPSTIRSLGEVPLDAGHSDSQITIHPSHKSETLLNTTAEFYDTNPDTMLSAGIIARKFLLERMYTKGEQHMVLHGHSGVVINIASGLDRI